jgi:integrase
LCYKEVAYEIYRGIREFWPLISGFYKNDKYFSMYYDGIFIIFKTGLRISEFRGLTIGDIDFELKRIMLPIIYSARSQKWNR